MIDIIYWGIGVWILLCIVWWPGYTREEIMEGGMNGDTRTIDSGE